MRALFARVLSAQRRRILGSKPIFEPYAPASQSALSAIESRIACELPASLRAWLLHAGFGDLNEELSFRPEWFSPIDRGPLRGSAIFAQDILGNCYSFSPTNGEIHYVCRSAPEFARIATDFCAFLEELESRSFQLEQWVKGLEASPYEWGA